MKYSASYDTTVKVVSILVTLLMFGTSFYLSFGMPKTSPLVVNILTSVLGILVCVGILLICYVYSPQYYMLNDDSFVVKRVVKDREIMLKDISEIRLIEPVELRGVIRTFGVGGLFGYFGKFASLKLGTMTWYATQKRNKVLMVLENGEKIVVTPDDTSIIDLIRSKKAR